MFHVPAHKHVGPNGPGQIVNVVHNVKPPEADFAVQCHGSICILTPVSEAASVWVRENLPADVQRWGGGVAIEPRFVSDILQGIVDSGLEVVR